VRDRNSSLALKPGNDGLAHARLAPAHVTEWRNSTEAKLAVKASTWPKFMLELGRFSAMH
jgi:hypothetical protein